MTQVQHEVLSNGRTVWVNSGATGACIARFSPLGVDVHNNVGQRTKGECYYCTHERPTLREWFKFVDMLRRRDSVDVSDYRSQWLSDGGER